MLVIARHQVPLAPFRATALCSRSVLTAAMYIWYRSCYMDALYHIYNTGAPRVPRHASGELPEPSMQALFSAVLF